MAALRGSHQVGLGRDRFPVEASRGSVEVLEPAHYGVFDAFGGVGGLLLAAEDGRQLAIEFDKTFALLDPLRGRVGPSRVLQTQFMAAAVVDQGIREPSLGPESTSQAAMGRGVVRLELDGFFELGDGPVQVLLLLQDIAQVEVGIDVLGVELDGLVELGDGLVQVTPVGQGIAKVAVELGRAWGRG